MNVPIVRTQMLIRRPVERVFQAIVDPAITTNFWFTKSTGRIEPGAVLRWDWEMYGAFASVTVKDVERNRRILMEWKDPPSPVEWKFEERGADATLLQISNWGFSGTEDEAVAAAIDSMGGFTSLLAGLKAFLEHDIRLNLVADHHPDAHIKSMD